MLVLESYVIVNGITAREVTDFLLRRPTTVSRLVARHPPAVPRGRGGRRRVGDVVRIETTSADAGCGCRPSWSKPNPVAGSSGGSDAGCTSRPGSASS